MKSSVIRRLCVALAVASLVIPAWSLAGRVMLHFVADFNQAPSSGDAPSFLAKGGTFVVQGPPGVFDVVVDASGNGVLSIGENSLPGSGTLTGVLDEPSYDSVIDLALTLVPSGQFTDLVVSLVDDNGGGMISLQFDDDEGGKLTVDGVTLPLNGGGGNGSGPPNSISIDLSLKATLLNVNTWQLTVSSAAGIQVASGFLPLTGPLSLAKVKIIRPGGTVSGSWTLDDLVISSPYDPGLVVK